MLAPASLKLFYVQRRNDNAMKEGSYSLMRYVFEAILLLKSGNACED